MARTGRETVEGHRRAAPALAGGWFKEKREGLKAKGIRIVIPNDTEGARHILAKTRIGTPADMKGQKAAIVDKAKALEGRKAMGGELPPMSPPSARLPSHFIPGSPNGARDFTTLFRPNRLDDRSGRA